MTDSMLSGHSYGAPPPTAFTTASPTISTDTGPSNTFASHGHMNGGQERDLDSRHYPHREEPSISRLPSTQSPYVTLLQKNRGKLIEFFRKWCLFYFLKFSFFGHVLGLFFQSHFTNFFVLNFETKFFPLTFLRPNLSLFVGLDKSECLMLSQWLFHFNWMFEASLNSCNYQVL